MDSRVIPRQEPKTAILHQITCIIINRFIDKRFEYLLRLVPRQSIHPAKLSFSIVKPQFLNQSDRKTSLQFHTGEYKMIEYNNSGKEWVFCGHLLNCSIDTIAGTERIPFGVLLWIVCSAINISSSCWASTVAPLSGFPLSPDFTRGEVKVKVTPFKKFWVFENHEFNLSCTATVKTWHNKTKQKLLNPT